MAPDTPTTSTEISKNADLSGSLGLEVRRSRDCEEGEDDEEQIRQEEREREQRALELLERRIGMADGSLKRLGKRLICSGLFVCHAAKRSVWTLLL